MRLLHKSSLVGLAIAAVAGVGSAQAVPACVNGSAATYTAPGFSCTVGALTFSGITITPSVTGDGVVGPISVGPISGGLALTFSSVATAPPPSTADVAWLYTVTSTAPITDAGLLLTGSGTAGGIVTLDETLSNGATLHAKSPGSATDHVTFAGVDSLSVAKDLADIALTSGALAVSSVIQNTFSTGIVPMPEPATFALLGAGLLGLCLVRRRRARSE